MALSRATANVENLDFRIRYEHPTKYEAFDPRSGTKNREPIFWRKKDWQWKEAPKLTPTDLNDKHFKIEPQTVDLLSDKFSSDKAKCSHVREGHDCPVEDGDPGCYLMQFDSTWYGIAKRKNEIREHYEMLGRKLEEDQIVVLPRVWSEVEHKEKIYIKPEDKSCWLICIEGWAKRS